MQSRLKTINPAKKPQPWHGILALSYTGWVDDLFRGVYVTCISSGEVKELHMQTP